MADQPTKRRRRQIYRVLAGAALLVLVGGTVVYHFLEDWSWVDSFYFCTVCITTVGFGDLAPTTDAAKLFTAAYIFAGMGIVATLVNVRLRERGFVARHIERRTAATDDAAAKENADT